MPGARDTLEFSATAGPNMTRFARIQLLFVAIALGAQAQWISYPDASLPRTRDGKPDLSAKAPRTADGKPDLSGIWQPEGASRETLFHYFGDGINGLGEDDPTVYFINFLADYKPDDPLFLPAARAAMAARGNGLERSHPSTRCEPWGMPIVDTQPSPSRIVQTPGLIVVMYEENMSHREIFLDGRKHTPDPQPTWLGYSSGHWEGDTLVVETTGFNSRSLLDGFGHAHSDAMRITERFHRLNIGRMELQLTLEDAKFYAHPVTVKFNLRLLPDTDLIESFCVENEKDLQHMIGR